MDTTSHLYMGDEKIGKLLQSFKKFTKHHDVFDAQWIDDASDEMFRQVGNKVRRLTTGRECTCVRCGVTANVIITYRHHNESPGVRHTDLFSMVPAHGLRMFTADHTLPKAWGGNSRVSNLRPMCLSCNQNKGDHLSSVEIHTMLAQLDDHLHWNSKKIGRFVQRLYQHFPEIAIIGMITL